jgi:hypothetical protein
MVQTLGRALPSKLLIFAQERRQLERLQGDDREEVGAYRS